jgi:hypothetical protein
LEFSRITGTVLEMRSISYRDSMAQILALGIEIFRPHCKKATESLIQLRSKYLCLEVVLLWRTPFVLCTELRHILEGMTNILQRNKNIKAFTYLTLNKFAQIYAILEQETKCHNRIAH